MSLSSSMTRVLLACGLGPAMFTVVLLIDGATRPGYDPLYRWGSELSLGDRGWLQITNFIVSGVLTLCFAVGLRRATRPGPRSTVGPILVALFGLTLIVAGAFSTDPFAGYPPGSPGTAEPTLTGTIHDINALPSFTILTAAVFVLAGRFADGPRGRTWLWYSRVTGLVVPVSLVAALALAGTGGPVGLLQRITIAAGFCWVSVFAVRLLRDHQRHAWREPATLRGHPG